MQRSFAGMGITRMGGQQIVVDLGTQRLRALCAEQRGKLLFVQRTLTTDIPDDLHNAEPEERGEWLREELRNADMKARGATFVLGRERVAMKRLHLPSTDEVELPDMARLAMRQELPFEADGAVIDYLPVADDETSTTIIAVAAPARELDAIRAIAKSAGLKINRIAMRGLCVPALLDTSLETDDTTLVVDALFDSVEFAIVDDDSIRMSRGAHLPQVEEPEAAAEAVITETRRTWMSYRIVEDAVDVRRVLVMGDHDVARHAVDPIGDMLGVPATLLEHHPLIDAGREKMDAHWPLAGLLLEESQERETIDFAHPRQAPDVNAKKRQLTLAAAGVLIVLLLAAGTWAKRDLGHLDNEIERLNTRNRNAEKDYLRVSRNDVKREHLHQWEQIDADWLAHLQYLNDLRTADDAVVFDQWSGRLESRGVEWDRTENEWSAPSQLSFLIDGEARDRNAADDFRSRLVDADLYIAKSTGADKQGGRRLPFGFTYSLRSKRLMAEGGGE